MAVPESPIQSIVQSVNVGRPRPNPYKTTRATGIDKRPAPGPVEIRQPAAGTSGLAGDHIGDRKHHGGPDQALYAYAREDLDAWEQRLGRELPDGFFGENLTTRGLEVNNVPVGTRWRIGDTAVVQVTCPRIPCSTFRGWLGQPGWLRTFTEAARPGAYLGVVVPGPVRGGDPVTVVHAPDHDITVTLMFRALTTEPELRARLGDAGADLIEELRADIGLS